MRIHGHGEGTSHIVLVRGLVAREGIALGEKTNVDDRLIGAANHHGMSIYVTNLQFLHVNPRT